MAELLPNERRLSGKSARRVRVQNGHEALHWKYGNFVAKHGNALTYAQWLHPQMRRPFEIAEARSALTVSKDQP